MIYFKSELFPVGRLGVYSLDGKIFRIDITDETESSPDGAVLTALGQLREYFRAERFSFDFPTVCPNATAFQTKVWDALRDIPYGETASYGELAEKIGSPRAQRAVGSAVGKNPLLIVNPCHRVIKSDGSIGGFAYGTDMKMQLLELEKKNKGKLS